MGSDSLAAWRNRHAWAAVLALLVLAPAIIAPPVGLIVAVPAAIAVAVVFIRWPQRGISLSTAAAAVAALSLVVDVVYPGAPGLALFWLPFEMLALLLLAGMTIRLADDNKGLAIGALCLVATQLLPLRFTLRMDESVLSGSVIMVALAFPPAAIAAGIGFYLRAQDRRRRRAVSEARRDQRLWVAGDLHDFVAHEVTGIVLEAQAAQLESLDLEQAKALFSQIEVAGMRALESMDQTVRTLRDPNGESVEDAPPVRVYCLADLPALVDRFSSGAAMTATLDLPEELIGVLNPEREAAVYAVVLEALTNTRRHAPRATEVRVGLRALPGPELEVSVEDNGRSGGGLVGHRVGGGTGLVGIEERVRTLGGRLSVGRTESGWRVGCVFPAPALAAGAPEPPTAALPPGRLGPHTV